MGFANVRAGTQKRREISTRVPFCIAAGHNVNAIVPESTWNAHIANNTIRTRDDCLSLKAGMDWSGRMVNISTENVLIESNAFFNGLSRPSAGSLFRTRMTACCPYRAETGPYFVPGLPHIVAHPRRPRHFRRL